MLDINKVNQLIGEAIEHIIAYERMFLTSRYDSTPTYKLRMYVDGYLVYAYEFSCRNDDDGPTENIKGPISKLEITGDYGNDMWHKNLDGLLDVINQDCIL